MNDHPYAIAAPFKSVEAFWKSKNSKNQNAGLIFERFTPDWSNEDSNKRLKAEKKEPKTEGLKAVQAAFEKADKTLLKEWNLRWEKTILAAEAEFFSMQTDWRMIAGLGKKGSLEVGFTFHRYGFPYLPGSSLKGLARAYGLLEIASLLGKEKLEILRKTVSERVHKKPDEVGLLSALDATLSLEDEDKETFKEEFDTCKPPEDVKEMAQGFRQTFGTTETAGKAIFFDAIPSAKVPPKLELDIMNPHYPDYYKEMGIKDPKAYPTNWQSPIPVQFLTVASGSVFLFAIGWRNSPQDHKEDSEKKKDKWNGWFKGEQITQKAKEESPRLIKLARRWLQGGLLELGAGGKTSAGYGYFNEAS